MKLRAERALLRVLLQGRHFITTSRFCSPNLWCVAFRSISPLHLVSVKFPVTSFFPAHPRYFNTSLRKKKSHVELQQH